MSLTLLPDSEKLQTANWNEWKRALTAILRMKGLMGFVDGSVGTPRISRPLPQTPNAQTPETPTPAAPDITSNSNPFAPVASTSNPFDVSQNTPAQSTGQILGVSPSQGQSQTKPLPSIPQTHFSPDEWSCLDASASAHITLNIKNQTILSKFKDGATAREIWSSLHARFERTNGILALKARNRLSECKYTDGKDVQSHLDSMSKLWQEALAVGVRIEDTEFCHILRSSFPPSWAILIATLVPVEDPISLEASLLAFADLRGTPSRPTAPTSSTALLSSTTKCTNCGKDNHTFEKCFRKGGGSENSAPHWWRTRNQGSSSQDQPRAKVATVDAPPQPIPDIAAFAAHHHVRPNNPLVRPNNPFVRSNNPFIHSNNPFNHFNHSGSPSTSDYHLFVASIETNTSTHRRVATYADSGASHHYFVNRSDFSTYMEISPITGQGAGKDSTFKIVGVGSVQKDVIVDGKRQSVIFRNVAHAPDLAANLVSISRLDADGAVILVEK